MKEFGQTFAGYLISSGIKYGAYLKKYCLENTLFEIPKRQRTRYE